MTETKLVVIEKKGTETISYYRGFCILGGAAVATGHMHHDLVRRVRVRQVWVGPIAAILTPPLPGLRSA